MEEFRIVHSYCFCLRGLYEELFPRSFVCCVQAPDNRFQQSPHLPHQCITIHNLHHHFCKRIECNFLHAMNTVTIFILINSRPVPENVGSLWILVFHSVNTHCRDTLIESAYPNQPAGTPRLV